jgi:hypothetical protein
MKTSGINPATFRFVAQCLNYCATAHPQVDSSAKGNQNLFSFLGTKHAIEHKACFPYKGTVIPVQAMKEWKKSRKITTLNLI